MQEVAVLLKRWLKPGQRVLINSFFISFIDYWSRRREVFSYDWDKWINFAQTVEPTMLIWRLNGWFCRVLQGYTSLCTMKGAGWRICLNIYAGAQATVLENAHSIEWQKAADSCQFIMCIEDFAWQNTKILIWLKNCWFSLLVKPLHRTQGEVGSIPFSQHQIITRTEMCGFFFVLNA